MARRGVTKESIMGTRALTVLREEDGTEIAVLYQQYDGDSHGQKLEDMVKGRPVVNGFNDLTQRPFNGGGCLAAQIVAHFKGDRTGGFYLMPAGTRDVGEEYVYTIRPVNGRIKITTKEANWRTP